MCETTSKGTAELLLMRESMILDVSLSSSWLRCGSGKYLRVLASTLEVGHRRLRDVSLRLQGWQLQETLFVYAANLWVWGKGWAWQSAVGACPSLQLHSPFWDPGSLFQGQLNLIRSSLLNCIIGLGACS